MAFCPPPQFLHMSSKLVLNKKSSPSNSSWSRRIDGKSTRSLGWLLFNDLVPYKLSHRSLIYLHSGNLVANNIWRNIDTNIRWMFNFHRIILEKCNPGSVNIVQKVRNISKFMMIYKWRHTWIRFEKNNMKHWQNSMRHTGLSCSRAYTRYL